jgi:hypothetical protein
MTIRMAADSGSAWLDRATDTASSGRKTSFCVSPQSLVTCLLAGTPFKSKRSLFPGAGTTHGAACWLISS